MLGSWTSRVAALKKLPVAKLLVLGEIAMVAREHALRLEPAERRRLLELVRRGRGRRRNLSEDERHELAELIAKTEPRAFVGRAAERLSPVPLPDWMVRGRSGR
jgi:hypothetical protein